MPAMQRFRALTGLACLRASRAFTAAASPLLSLEHVNLNVPAWTPALEKFWFEAMGLARDPRTTAIVNNTISAGGSMKGLVWANIGLQQVHMPVGEQEDSTQQVRGTVGLAFDDLGSLRERLHGHGVDFEEDDGGAVAQWFGPGLRVQSPTGVKLRVHGGGAGGSRRLFGPAEAESGGVALPGGPTLGVGMPYVELLCGLGAAAGICRFYRETLGVHAELADGACRVPIRHQFLLFRETASELPAYDGHHVAIYVGDISREDTSTTFSAMYEKCRAAELVFNNPRFPHLRYDTLEDAKRLGEFRILDLIDPESGKVAYTLEHEIRSLEHPGFSCRSLLKQGKGEL
mmetsp:Transcript_96557/g.288221  ORF Transcript_96557/g.288221 Transcript_96557/m.288221 type:complete len:345 (-) Transcript_96557:86-1120(-)